MRLRIQAWTLAFLFLSATASAQGIEIGPQFAIPLPASDVGGKELGFSAGVTATDRQNRPVQVGVDVVYHYWPAAPEFKTGFDEVLKRRFYLAINEPTWAFVAIQTTFNLKVDVPLGERFASWLKFGAGVYTIDRNIEGLWSDGINVSSESGFYGSLGMDYKESAGRKIGLDATYHHLKTARPLGSDFTAFEIGAHMLFGR